MPPVVVVVVVRVSFDFVRLMKRVIERMTFAAGSESTSYALTTFSNKAAGGVRLSR